MRRKRPALSRPALQPAYLQLWSRAVAAATLAGLLASTAGPAAAQQAAPSAEAARGRLEATRQQLDERRRVEKEIAANIGQLRSERDQLNQSLIDTARQIQKTEGQLSGIEARIGELEVQERILKGSLANRHDQIARLLAAMQRMGRNPPPVMITRREDALQMVRSAMMLARTFPEMREQALALAGQLSELARIKGEIQSQGDSLKAETASLNEQRTRMALLLETKRQSLAERQSDLDKIRREAAEIAKNVSDLNELIVRLDKAVAQHTGQDAVRGPALPAAEPAVQPEREAGTVVAAVPPAIEPKPQDVAAATQSPVAPLSPTLQPADIASPVAAPKAVELAPKGTQVASLSPGRLKPATSFAQTRGTLQLPAQGRKVLAFGDKTQYGERSKGIVLETRASGQVTAPVDAWVVFAGEFRTFGQLLIINAGDGYHILLAGLSHIDVQLGEFVLAGQPVGVMSGAAKPAKGQAADNAPVLYIEFRKDGRPIDPDPWWAADARQKVQG